MRQQSNMDSRTRHWIFARDFYEIAPRPLAQTAMAGSKLRECHSLEFRGSRAMRQSNGVDGQPLAVGERARRLQRSAVDRAIHPDDGIAVDFAPRGLPARCVE